MAGKTGNGKIHGTTRLVPAEEFEIERKYLLPYYGEPVPPKDEPKEYHVRKDNTVRYRTNYYSVPSGTYKIGTPLYGFLRITDISSCTTKRAVNSYAGMSCVPEKGKMYVTKDIIRTRHGAWMTCRSGSESGRKMTPPLFCGSGIWKGKSRAITGTIWNCCFMWYPNTAKKQW